MIHMDRQPLQPSALLVTIAPWEQTHLLQQMAAQVTPKISLIFVIQVTKSFAEGLSYRYSTSSTLLFLSIGNVCPEGHYCIQGSSKPEPCGNGTYMNHTGASTCYICPAGRYCVNRDRADVCLQGYYCPEGTGADLQPCPTGTFGNTTGLINETQCTPCTGNNTELWKIINLQYCNYCGLNRQVL